jgi:hypothetical protein
MMGVMQVDPGTLFAPPVGGGATAPQGEAETLAPPGQDLIAKDLAATVPEPPGSNEFVELQLIVNGSNTPLQCLITELSHDCQAPSSFTAEVPGGARLVMRSAGSNNVGSKTISWGFRLVPAP